MIDVNASGAYNFMVAARQQGFNNAILAGSAPVHLNCDINKLLLDTASDEDHAYDLSKVLQEVIARDFHAHGTPVMCLRFGHVVRGALAINLGTPTPLAEFTYCQGGWVALEDVIKACVHALALSPNQSTFEVLNLVGSRAARERFQVSHTEERLAYKLAYDFAEYE